MKYFLISAELPIKDGVAKSSFVWISENPFFGKEEVDRAMVKMLASERPEEIPAGKTTILFAMEITKKQSEYYIKN